ncbi:unnamed protein product [Heterobilharzia americana]|nr:unnamed protein product [Heterobilharzia americana]
MGSPLRPLLPDVYMLLTELMVQDLITNVILYRRYVDDIFVICDTDEDAKRLLKRLNTIQDHISLTCEEEKDHQLAFLDILLCRREDGSIKRSIYRKSTWTGQYLNFHSFCQMKYNRGLVRCLFNRIQRICTSDTMDDENKFPTDTLVENGYPLQFVNHCKKQLTPKPTVSSVLKEKHIS